MGEYNIKNKSKYFNIYVYFINTNEFYFFLLDIFQNIKFIKHLVIAKHVSVICRVESKLHTFSKIHISSILKN